MRIKFFVTALIFVLLVSGCTSVSETGSTTTSTSLAPTTTSSAAVPATPPQLIVPAAPFTGHTGDVIFVGWSLDGTNIISASPYDSIRIWNASNRDELKKILIGDKFISVAMNKDSTKIALGYSDSVRIIDLNSGSVISNFKTRNGAGAIGWTPDSSNIIFASGDGRIRSIDSSTGDEIFRSTQVNVFGLFPIAISPDGKEVAATDTSTNGAVAIYDGATGDPKKVLGSFEDEITGLAWSPDNKLALIFRFDKNIYIYDMADGKKVNELAMPDYIGAFSWSPDGKMFAFSAAGKIHIWDAQSWTELKTFTQGDVASLSWSLEGKRLASSSGSAIRLWKVS